MGDINEDVNEILQVIDAHVTACTDAVEARWCFWEGAGTKEDLTDSEAAVDVTREAMVKALRAFADPRTCA